MSFLFHFIINNLFYFVYLFIILHYRNLMKTIILFAFIFVFSLASSFDDVKAIARNDQCAFERLDILKPLIEV